ncbi:hypothetical protein DWB63_09180 [Pseudodesulfovibrio sp. S3]|nr:hypothetical protein DWB63_09180 [Pseudodesulfovibrio sp. S3]
MRPFSKPARPDSMDAAGAFLLPALWGIQGHEAFLKPIFQERQQRAQVCPVILFSKKAETVGNKG